MFATLGWRHCFYMAWFIGLVRKLVASLIRFSLGIPYFYRDRDIHSESSSIFAVLFFSGMIYSFCSFYWFLISFFFWIPKNCRPSILVSDLLWQYDEIQSPSMSHLLVSRRQETSPGILSFSVKALGWPLDTLPVPLLAYCECCQSSIPNYSLKKHDMTAKFLSSIFTAGHHFIDNINKRWKCKKKDIILIFSCGGFVKAFKHI